MRRLIIVVVIVACMGLKAYDKKYTPFSSEVLRMQNQDIKDISFFRAAIHGDLDFMRARLRSMSEKEKLAFINTRDKNGGTVVYYATCHGQPKVVDFLLKLGATPCQHDYAAKHVLEVAAKLIEGYKRILRTIKENPVNAQLINIGRAEREMFDNALRY